ncbi:pilus assembly protein TadG-related protein [Rhizobium rhizosphaerae]|nr:pilus assembly protein TadG-related protein [Xaviernesmea rhizosphaerae]
MPFSSSADPLGCGAYLRARAGFSSTDRKIINVIKQLIASQHANLSIMTAFMLVGMLGAVGLGVDVSQAVSIKHELQGAADAAALAVLSTQSSTAKQAMQAQDGNMAQAEADAGRVFNANAGKKTYIVTRKVSVVKQNGILTATVNFTATVPTTFSRILGQPVIEVKGKAIAQTSTAAYRDFYMLLDNTPSMGLGATNADIAKMRDLDNCVFACHVVKGGVVQPSDTYGDARAAGITTRIDMVARAAASLMDTAKQARLVPDQFRVALYTFGPDASKRGLTEISPLTDDLDSVKPKATTIDLMSVPNSSYDDDQMTDFDRRIGDVGKVMSESAKGASGTGRTADDPEKILFFVTDGVNDANKPNGCSQPLHRATRCQEPIATSVCNNLKQAGFRIAILYTTYLKMKTDDGWYEKWIQPFDPQISPALKACASPSLFFEVSPSAGIDEAMKALFFQAINTPRLVG